MVKQSVRIVVGAFVVLALGSTFVAIRGRADDDSHGAKKVIITSASGDKLAEVTSDNALKVNVSNTVKVSSDEPLKVTVAPSKDMDSGELKANEVKDFKVIPKSLIVCVVNGTFRPDFTVRVGPNYFDYNLNGKEENAHVTMCASVPPFQVLRANNNTLDYQASF